MALGHSPVHLYYYRSLDLRLRGIQAGPADLADIIIHIIDKMSQVVK